MTAADYFDQVITPALGPLSAEGLAYLRDVFLTDPVGVREWTEDPA